MLEEDNPSGVSILKYAERHGCQDIVFSDITLDPNACGEIDYENSASGYKVLTSQMDLLPKST